MKAGPYTFDVQALFDYFGGPAKVAKILGTSRSTPHRILKAGSIQTNHLERLVDHDPSVSLDKFLKRGGQSEPAGETVSGRAV